MKINAINPNTNFRGYLDKSVYKYVQKQVSKMIDEKMDNAKKEGRKTLLSEKEMYDIADKGDSVISNLSEIALDMHPATRLYIEQGRNGQYSFLKAQNDNMPNRFIKSEGIYPVTYPVENETAKYSLKYWTVMKERGGNPEERLAKLGEYAREINPKETDKAIVRDSIKRLINISEDKASSNKRPASKATKKKIQKAAQQIATIQGEIGYKDAKKDIGIKHGFPKEIDKIFLRQQYRIKH